MDGTAGGMSALPVSRGEDFKAHLASST
jgi:hypothetical protein